MTPMVARGILLGLFAVVMWWGRPQTFIMLGALAGALVILWLIHVALDGEG